MEYERIRSLREDRVWTQKRMAELLFINRRTYSSYETCVRSMSPEILIKLARIHNVSIDYLLKLTDEKRPIKGNEFYNYAARRSLWELTWDIVNASLCALLLT